MGRIGRIGPICEELPVAKVINGCEGDQRLRRCSSTTKVLNQQMFFCRKHGTYTTYTTYKTYGTYGTYTTLWDFMAEARAKGAGALSTLDIRVPLDSGATG
jgi:hypothetical protein